MVKREQIRRCQELQKYALRSPLIMILIRNEIRLCIRHNLFITGTIFTTIHYMKPAWLAEPIFFILALRMGAPRATPAGCSIKSTPDQTFFRDEG